MRAVPSPGRLATNARALCGGKRCKNAVGRPRRCGRPLSSEPPPFCFWPATDTHAPTPGSGHVPTHPRPPSCPLPHCGTDGRRLPPRGLGHLPRCRPSPPSTFPMCPCPLRPHTVFPANHAAGEASMRINGLSFPAKPRERRTPPPHLHCPQPTVPIPTHQLLSRTHLLRCFPAASPPRLPHSPRLPLHPHPPHPTVTSSTHPPNHHFPCLTFPPTPPLLHPPL